MKRSTTLCQLKLSRTEEEDSAAGAGFFTLDDRPAMRMEENPSFNNTQTLVVVPLNQQSALARGHQYPTRYAGSEGEPVNGNFS